MSIRKKWNKIWFSIVSHITVLLVVLPTCFKIKNMYLQRRQYVFLMQQKYYKLSVNVNYIYYYSLITFTTFLFFLSPISGLFIQVVTNDIIIDLLDIKHNQLAIVLITETFCFVLFFINRYQNFQQKYYLSIYTVE